MSYSTTDPYSKLNTCLGVGRVPNSGSFIRPTAPNLDYGRSFLRALVDKYVELPQGSSGSEYVTLGSSNGSIRVEAVNLDKIRGKFSNLERLREISLDREGVSCQDEAGAIRERLSSELCCIFASVTAWL